VAIDVEWQNERGERLARHDGPPLDARLPGGAPDSSACLRFIDPYDDTTFNAAQVAALEQELSSLSAGDHEVAEHARALLEFVRRFGDRTHRYLKFTGD
jgi:hypothetical protein